MARNAEQTEALDYLREYFKPGDTVYTIMRHVSSDGMSRRISVLAAITDREGKPGIYNVSHLVARAGLFRKSRANEASVLVGGCGMDMGYHVAYSLSRALFPDGGTDRNGTFREDGGYVLSHQWVH